MPIPPRPGRAVPTRRPAASNPTRRFARRLGLAALPAAAALLVGALIPGSAAAAPPPTIDQVKARIAELNSQAESVSEQYNGQQITLADLQAKADQATARRKAAEADLQAQRQKLGEYAGVLYRDGSSQMIGVALSSDPVSYLERTDTLRMVTEQQRSTITSVKAAGKRLTEAEQQAAAAAAAVQQTVTQLAAKKAEINGLIKQEQDTLDRLTAEEKARLAAQQAAEAAASAARAAAARAALAAQQAAAQQAAAQQAAAQQAAAQQAAAQQAAAQQAAAQQAAARQAAAQQAAAAAPAAVSRPAAPAPAPAAAPARGSVSQVIATALAQVGKPYVFGATGPDSFDCSGLTMYAYASIGVYLPHFTGAQYGAGRHVSLSALAPGDLVFYGSDLHHVALYIGGGNVVEAPHTGASVQVVPVGYPGSPVGAVRILG